MYIGLGERRKKYRETKKYLKRQSTDSHRLKGVKKNKPLKNGKSQRVWIMYIIVLCYL